MKILSNIVKFTGFYILFAVTILLVMSNIPDTYVVDEDGARVFKELPSVIVAFFPFVTSVVCVLLGSSHSKAKGDYKKLDAALANEFKKMTSASTVTGFASSYEKAIKIIYQQINLSRKSHIRMNPNPEKRLESIKSNSSSIINELIDRCVSSIPNDLETIWYKYINLSEEFANNTVIRSMLSDENKKRIYRLKVIGAALDEIGEDFHRLREDFFDAIDILSDKTFCTIGELEKRLNSSSERVRVIVSELEYANIIKRVEDGSVVFFLCENIEEAKYKFIVTASDKLQNIEAHINEIEQALSFHAYPSKRILSEVDKMKGHDFEYWCAELLRKLGYTNAEVTKGSGDQGVDVLASKEGIRYAIQCKCYSSNLGNTPVQEVNAGKSMYNCQIGVVMTNRYFTAGAKDLANTTGILLWDRDKLQQMIETVL